MLLANIHNYIYNNEIHSEYYDQVSLLAKKGNSSKIIGFYGQPDQKAMELFNSLKYRFLDLDIDFKHRDEKIVPENYCHIIRDIINNAIYYRDEIEYILSTTGTDKCDQGRNVRDLLSQLGFSVIDASNCNKIVLRKPIISQSKGPLKDRVIRIMELAYKPLTDDEVMFYTNNQCQPRFNFHGVPPHDINLLTYFPPETHIQGWTRLVEMGIPSKSELEWELDNDSPTVFYAQSFCNKEMMAKYLSEKHNGLYLDGHNRVTGSILARLEAFIRLKGKYNKITPVNSQSNKVLADVAC